jgi:hypothetical protein
VANFEIRIQWNEILGFRAREAALAVDEETSDGLAAVVGHKQSRALCVKGNAVNVTFGCSYKRIIEYASFNLLLRGKDEPPDVIDDLGAVLRDSSI